MGGVDHSVQQPHAEHRGPRREDARLVRDGAECGAVGDSCADPITEGTRFDANAVVRAFASGCRGAQGAVAAYATTSRYAADALAFAKAHSINAQDGTGLLKPIAQRTPEQQARLLEVAYEGEYWKPTCASCGVKMTERESRKDSSRFWGCVNYPRCKRTLVMQGG